MKLKKCYFVILLLLIIVITSCTFDNDNEISDFNDTEETSRFLYTVEGKKLVRYDVVEHKEIVACPDPLCEHDTEDCLVSDIYRIRITDKYIAYVKEMNEGWSDELLLYDLEDGNINVIFSSENDPQIYYPWISVDYKYVFFTASTLLYDDQGNSTDEVWNVYRYSISTTSLDVLNEGESILTGYNVLEDTENRLLWWSNYTGEMFWTDYEYKNIENEDSYVGETIGENYLYSDIKYTEYNDYYRTVYLENIETGKKSLILDNVSEIRRDNNSSTKGLVYGMFDYNEEYGYNAKSEIWYYDFETGESRLLIDVKDISDEFDTFNIASHEGYNDYAGGYVMIYIGHTYTYVNEDNEEMMSFYATHNLFINPETGDWFIMEPLY